MKVLVVAYNAGNIHSIMNALHYIGVQPMLSSSATDFQHTPIAIFPGVGNIASAMADLKRRGLDIILRDFVERGGYMLGICVGAQLLFEHSAEEDTQSLGFIPGSVRRLSNSDMLLNASTPLSDTTHKLKVPHIGWNYCSYRYGNPLFRAIPQHSAFYFVHSYYCMPRHHHHTIAHSYYGTNFASAVQHHRMFGVQFHPEKSGRWGLQLLRNFVRYAHHSMYRERQRTTASATFSLQCNRRVIDDDTVSNSGTTAVDSTASVSPHCVNVKIRRLINRAQRVNRQHRYLLNAPWYDAIYQSMGQTTGRPPADA